MEQDKIRISNWFTNPKEFKKLVSYSIDWKKYKSVPSTFMSTTKSILERIKESYVLPNN